MRLMQFDSVPPMSYEEIVTKWRAASHSDVFTGHFLINFVTNTNQIENIDVDYNSTRELFESETVTAYTGDLRDIFSVMNNKNVAAYINSQLVAAAPISRELILEVHRLLMFASIDSHRYRDNGERAGVFKRKDYCVGKMSGGSLHEDVEEDINLLCTTCAENWDKDPLRVAAVFQCHFEYIHPFADGNGRVGRWLTNYILVANNHPPVLFSREKRKEYYAALEAFDASEDYTFMYRYLKEQTVLSWSSLREQI